MRFDDGAWTQPGLAPFAEDYMEFGLFVMPKGNRLYFDSLWPHPETVSTKDRIWYSNRIENGCCEAQLKT